MKVMEGRGFTVTRLSLTDMDSQEVAVAIRSSAVLVGAHGAGWVVVETSYPIVVVLLFVADKQPFHVM